MTTDDILKQVDTIMMLKPALDTSGKPAMEYITGTYPMNGKSEAEIRDYCAQCDDADSLVFTQNVNKVKDGEMVVPSKFYFDGEMIFISNMRASQIEDAIKSRSIFIDVYLCARDMYNRTKSIMKAKYPNKSDEQLDKFFETKDYHYLTTCKLTINPTPAEATVVINSEIINEVTVPYGSVVDYVVSCDGYESKADVFEITKDEFLEVVLDEDTTDTTESDISI